MTNKTYPRKFYILKSGLSVNLGDEWDKRNGVYYRGQVFEVDEAAYEHTLDKQGRSWLDLTPEEQEAKWGEPRFGEGELPDGIEFGDDDEHGFLFRKWQRETEQAKKISDPAERAQAFADIRKRYPKSYVSSQTTLRTY